ncbi:hypothetical protein [Actinophytocola sp.]|uniref:hypothetical protein n=1 Tax=Actinophytocola sp. TaxID=1872138 RepID=UPI002D7EDBCF|nr:hypothetical protein [Actinophytocola sp.]HET9139012.1 hypothetical protein [Actinophytocola sp.]HEU5108578.1 hypothetical protein [Micromonosporaceae bacterium]
MTAPHRLRLTAAEYAYLVDRLGLSMPPGWQPDPRDLPPAEPADLVKRGVLDGDGEVHRSVAMNLKILAGPQVMLDTTATIGGAGLHSLHAIAGRLGASLFELGDGAVELSLFAASDLGGELVRAVPPEAEAEIPAALGETRDRLPAGRVPVAALHELGIAELLRGADPDAPAEVLAGLGLAPAEARLATEVASRTNGGLVCQVTARVRQDVRSARVAWLHAGDGWLGMRPDTGRRVLLEPVGRADLGVWVAPFVAEAVTEGES